MSFGPLTFIAPYQFNNHFLLQIKHRDLELSMAVFIFCRGQILIKYFGLITCLKLRGLENRAVIHLFTKTKHSTVLPAKSDSDVMYYLQSY